MFLASFLLLKIDVSCDPMASYQTGERNHEAGFDAFITGFAMLRLAYYAYVAANPDSQAQDYKEIVKKSISDEVLQNYINRGLRSVILRNNLLTNNQVFVMRSETHLNLGGADPLPDFSKILFVADFDTTFKTSGETTYEETNKIK